MSAISEFVKRQGEWNHAQDVAVAAIAAKMDELMSGANTLEDNLALDALQAHTEQVTKLLQGLVTKKPGMVTSQPIAGQSPIQVPKPAP